LTRKVSVNKGTLILLAPDAKNADVSSKNVAFTFQFNPDKLQHTFNQPSPTPQGVEQTSASQGSIVELFNLTFELDNIDVDSTSQNTELGLHPTLAMLELMMQPQTLGKQTVMPIVVFSWGAKRAVPVRVVSMDVEEESFDATLNPMRATVNICLRVLDAAEVNGNAGAKSIYLSRQSTRATLVDAYKVQTGQFTPPVVAIEQTSVAVSASGALSVQKST
jgi:hypothetical protein